MKLVAAKQLQILKEVNSDQEGELLTRREENEQLHHFSCRKNKNNGLLDISVYGIVLSEGYSKVQFYKTNSQGIMGVVAVKGVRPDEKCDFTTDYMSDIVKDLDEIDFFEGVNGEVIAICKKQEITMDFERDVTPTYLVDNGKIKLYTCETQINGKRMQALVTSVKEDNGKSVYYMNGNRVQAQRKTEGHLELVKGGR